MRGKDALSFFANDIIRITPAYAGKRRLAGLKCYHVRDHPRVCGEKGQKVLNQRYTTGSPPRMRGKVGFVVLVQTAIGITPACAGKRELRSASGSACRDHPRMCGEKLVK